MNLHTKKKYFAGALLIATTGFFASSAGFAQAPATASPDNKDEPQKLEKFVVTGSNIPQTETAFTAGVSPVVRIDRQVIDESGISSTSELLQQITISNGGSVPISNNATGFTPAASSISLRGLGGDATLVLINGRRVATYPVGNGGTTAFVDLNSIPLSAVDSIEVLKDGASAVYGADAVAGVVNIKLRRSIDGSEVMIRYGNTTSKDSGEVTASIITGAQTDKASALVGFDYYKRNAIFNRDRDYSAIPPFLSSNASPINLNISRAAALDAGVPDSALPAGKATFYAASPADLSNAGATPAANYTYGAGRPSHFNFNEFSMSYPSHDNRGMFASAERKIFDTDNIKLYVDTNYQNANTKNELAPTATGNFTTSGQTELVIPARTANPLPTTDGRARAAVAGAYNPFNPFNEDIAGGSRARLAEFGNRIFRNATDAAMITAGIKGENIAGKWNFDAGYSYSSIRNSERNTLVSSSRFNRLLNANDSFFQPGSADFLGTTTPYNPFGYYKTSIPNNAAIVQAALIDAKNVDESYLNSFNAVISTDNVFEVPAGPVGFALGADARHEELNQYPDPYGATGDLIGNSPNAITRGQRKVWAAFAEANIPLLKNVVAANELSASLAARHEDFVTSNQTTTVPKIGLVWKPIDNSWLLRATWSKGFREPSLFELYSSPTAGLLPITNVGNGAFDPETNITTAGNRRLAPEKTKSYNIGTVWTPEFKGLKGLTLSVDYWRVERDGTVSFNVQDTVDRFFGHDSKGVARTGGLLPGESVILFPDGNINVVNSVFFNIGQTIVSGFDFAGSYILKTDSLGLFEVSTEWSRLEHYRQTTSAGVALQELLGQDTGESTGGVNGYLKLKGRIQTRWALKGYTVVFGTNYTDGFDDFDIDGNPFKVASTWIFDAQVSYNFRDRFGPWLKDTKLSVGARDLFNRNPPFSSGSGGNSTGYPSFLYTSENRFVYVSLDRKF